MLFKTSRQVNVIGVLIVMMVLLLFVLQPAHAEQVNGEYTIEFNILHADQRNASIAEGYWDQPAKVFIKDGQIRVQTTINKHAWVTEFAINENGSMKEVQTLSVDEAADLRVTEFQVANLTDLVESKVSVYIEEIDYDHSYTMYFKFKTDTLTLVKAEETQESEVAEEPTASPQPPATTTPSDPKESPAEQPAKETPEETEEPAASTVDSSDTQDSSSESAINSESSESASSADSSDVQHEIPAEPTEDEIVDVEEADEQEKTAESTAKEAESEDHMDLTATHSVEEETNNNISGIIFMIPIVIFVIMVVIAVLIYRKNREEA